MKITGGTFTGNKAKVGCSIYARGDFTLGGDVSFDVEQSTTGLNSTVFLLEGVLITPESGYSGTCYVSRQNQSGVISTVTTSEMTKHFALDFPKYGGRNYSIQYNKDNQLEIVKSSPSITVTTDGNGTAKTDKTTANVGEEVTVSYSSEYPYILDSIKVYKINNSDLIEIEQNNGKFIMPDYNVLVTVSFKPDYRSVTLAETQNGSVSLNKTQAVKDEEIIFSVTPAEGYVLDEYKVYKTGDNTTVVEVDPIEDKENEYHFAMPTYDVTVEASFCLKAEKKYNITYATGEFGSLSGDKNRAKPGETVTLGNTATSHYIFEYYKVYKTGDSNTVVEVVDGKFIMPEYDVTVTGGYQKGFAITCENSDKGTVSVTKNTAKYGATVFLSNNPLPPYVFEGYTAYKTEDPSVSVPVEKGLKDGEIVYYIDMPAYDVTVSASFCKEEDKLYSILIGTSSNGQVSTDVSKAKAGTKVKLSNTPDSSYINAGYLVCKLDDSETTISVTDDIFIMPAFDVAVYGGFVKGYTITSKNSTGGNVSADVSIAREGDVITLSNNPDSGYAFDEYRVYKTEDPTETVKIYSNGQFYMPAYDITIEATFTNIAEKNYNITIYEKAERGTSSADKTKATAGETITLSNTANNPYILAYYIIYNASDYSVTFNVTDGSFTMPAYDIVIVPAYYTGYNITTKNSTNGKVSADVSIAREGQMITLSNVPDSGYDFDEYRVYKTEDPSQAVKVYSNGKFYMPAYDITIEATFTNTTENNYNITIYEEAEYGTSSADKTKATAGDTITLSNTANNPYILAYYTVYNASDYTDSFKVTGSSFKMPDHDVIIVSVYYTGYNITVETVEHGTASVNKTLAKVKDVISINTKPDSGYLVDSIEVYKTGDLQTTVSVSDGKFTMPKYDVTVKVSYISKADKSYAITSKVDANGTVSAVENSKAGQEITVNATPNSGYILDSLKVYKTGDVNTTVAVSDGKFTMPEYDVTVEASFVRTYSITIPKLSGGTVTIKDDKVIAKAGETINLEHTDVENSKFVQYVVYKTIDKNTTVQVTDDGSFVMPSYDVTVSAKYDKDYIIEKDESITHGKVEASVSKAKEKEMVTLTSTPENSSYCFKEYRVYKTGEENTTVEVINKFGLYYFYMPDYDVTVSAEFVKISSITVLTVENGTVEADQTTAKTGETVSLSNTPDVWYKFKEYNVYYMDGGVKTEASVTDGEFIMPEYDVYVEASFEDKTHKISKEGSNYTVNITRNTDTGNAETALEGDTVSISCVPDVGYILESYTVCKDDAEETSITVTDGKFEMPDCDVLIKADIRERDENDVVPSGTVNDCLTFKSDVAFKIEVPTGYDGYLYYSTNGSDWKNVSDTKGGAGICSADKNITDNKYYLYFAGKANTVITKYGSHWQIGDTEYIDEFNNNVHHLSDHNKNDVKVDSSGNIMTLLDYENPDDQIMGDYAFYQMFAWCTELLSVPNLSATILADHCYENMFLKCTSLKTASKLQATSLATSCYRNMFNGCISLITVPDLPATTLADSCYSSMFNGCISLITAPDLPATTLANSCYYGMFENCTSLTTSPLLPSKDVKSGCYAYMFKGCSKLKVTTVKPEEGCYNAYYFYYSADAYDYMFKDTASDGISKPQTEEHDSKAIYYIMIYTDSGYSYSKTEKVTLENDNNVDGVAVAYTGSRVVVVSDISQDGHTDKISYTKNGGSSIDITSNKKYEVSLEDKSIVTISHLNHPDYDDFEFEPFPETKYYDEYPWIGYYDFEKNYYYFPDNDTMYGHVKIPNGKELVLCLNGIELQGWYHFDENLEDTPNKIINYGDLTIYNCKDTGSLDMEIINYGNLTICGNIELKGASKITNNGSLTLKGNIKDTAGIVNNGTITLSGNVEVTGSSENIKLATGTYITLNDFTGIAGVTLESGKGQITTNGSENDIEHFTSDNADYTVEYSAENGYLYLAGEETEPDPGQSEDSVTGVDIYPTKLMLHEGESDTLIATVFPESATNQNYIWKSSNDEVATVDKDGTVKALKAGTATITVTTEDGEKTATCSVTVTELTVSPTSKTLKIGDSIELKATMKPDSLTDKSVVWYSDNTEIAEVDQNTGEVTAKGVGTTTITAVSNADGSSAKCSVTVEKGSSSITNNPEISDDWTYDAIEHELAVKGTTKNGTLYYALGENGTKAPESDWSEEIPTAINAGTYYIWYKSVGINENYSDTDPVYLGEVTIKQKELEVSVGTAKIVKGYDGSIDSGTLTGEFKVTGIADSDKLVKVSCISIPDYDDKTVGKNYTLKAGISITGDLNSNYKIKNNVTSISIPGEITKKEIVVKSGIEATDRSYKAGDKSVTLSTENAILDGKVPGEDLSISVAGEMSDDKAGENKQIILTNLSLIGASSGNYTLAESGNQSETTVTIAKIKVSVPQANMKLVYDGTEQTGVTLPANAKYTIQDNTATNASDSYLAIVALNDTDNYEWNLDTPTSEDQTIAWSITKKEISVTADNKETYVGSDLVALTYNSDSLCGDDSLTGELSTAANKDKVGTYDISQGTLSAGDNYSIVYTKGTYTVKEKTSQNLSFANSSITKTYGDSSFTHKVSGAKTTVTYSSSDESVATVNSNTGEVKILKAGTTTIKASAIETTTYDSGEATYTLTVNKAKVTKPTKDTTSFVYTGNEQQYSLTTNSLYTISNDKRTNAGSQTVSVVLNDKDNYVWADNTNTDLTFTFIVARATYDMTNAKWNYTKAFTYDGNEKKVEVTGLPNGVTVKDYTDNTKTDAGTYTAKVSLNYDKDNYNEISIDDLSWTINKVKVSVPSKATETLTYNSYEQTGIIIPVGTGNIYTISEYKGTNAGDYTATVTLTDKANYEWDLTTPTNNDQTIAWSIARKKVTVTAEDKMMNLGETVPEFIASTSGLIGEDNVSYTFNTLDPTTQGVYSIVPSGDVEQGNYIVTYIQGTLTATKTDSDAKANPDDVSKVLEDYQTKEEYNDKTLDVEVRTNEIIPQADRNLINKKLQSGKKVQFADANLYLIIKDNAGTTEKNIGDENDTLIAVTYKFDFTNKQNIQVLRVHKGVVDELTQTTNANGEYVTFNKNEGTITVTAMKYSTFAFSYSVVSSGDSSAYKVVKTGIDGVNN